jgi:ribosome-binding factor A
MVSRRIQRIERELREIVAMYLLTGLKIPTNGMVSITRVEVSPDIQNAKVLVSMLASDTEKEENLKVLNSATRELQQIINHQLPMRYCPKVKFILDKGFDNAQIVEQRLKEIKEKESK